MHFRHLPRLRVAASALLATASLLLGGCVVPGYPYNGSPPRQSPPSGVMVAEPAYPPYPYVYAPAPVVIAPSFYSGWGRGYWYGNSFWPYRNGCHFYNGSYYGGYNGNHWNGNRSNWQGGYGGWNR